MSTSELVFDVGAENFDTLVVARSQHSTILADFWAAWCAPCRTLAPILSDLAQEYGGRVLVAKIDTDQERELAARFGIRSLPTVKIFSGGTVVDEFVGAQPPGVIRSMLDRYAVRRSDSVRREARALHAQGQTEQALGLLRQAMDADPDDDRIALDLAELLLERGRLDEARAALQTLPDARRMEPDVRSILFRLDVAAIAKDAPDVEELERALGQDASDCEIRLKLAARRVLRQEYEPAMEQFLEILRRDRGFRDDAGRKFLVALFDLVEDPGLVTRYRSRMSSMLH